MSFTRDRTSDDEWRRALVEAPRILDATFVQSGSKNKGDLKRWSKLVEAQLS